MPIFPSSWPTAASDIAAAANEQHTRASKTSVRLTPAQRRQEAYTKLVDAIGEGDLSAVKDVLSNNPSVSLDEPGCERVHDAIFENFSSEIMDYLVTKDLQINPLMYMALAEKFSQPMYTYFCTSVVDTQARNYWANEFFNQALKNMLHDSNKIRTSSRQLRTQLLKDFPHLSAEMTKPYYNTRMWQVDLLGKLPLFYPENFHPDDQCFIENLADPLKQMCLRGIAARAEDVTIQQLHSITRFFENQPSYATAFSVEEQKSAQEKSDYLKVWRSIIPVGARTWEQTNIQLYLQQLQSQWPEDEVRMTGPHGQVEVSNDMSADLARMNIFLTTPDLDPKLGFDVYDCLFRFYPYLNITVIGQSNEKGKGLAIKHQNERGADDFFTTMIISGAPAATALMKSPSMIQNVDALLNDKMHLMKWVTKAPIAAIQMLCKERPHWKTWTDETGNSLAHYLCALRPASQLNEKVIGHLIRINPNWLIQPNNNGVTLNEIVQNQASASLKCWMEQQTLTAQLKSDASTKKKMASRPKSTRKM